MLILKVTLLVAGVGCIFGPLLTTFVYLIVYAVIYGITTGMHVILIVV